METKECKKCKEQINVKAKVCPHCGSKQGISIWLIVIIVIIVLGIAGGLSNSSSRTKKSVSKSEKFTLLEHSISDESNDFAMYIEGKIKNNKNKEYTYVQVTFTTYDKEGNTIGTCLDNNSGLEANGTWKFKAICTESIDKIDHYELKEITGW